MDDLLTLLQWPFDGKALGRRRNALRRALLASLVAAFAPNPEISARQRAYRAVSGAVGKEQRLETRPAPAASFATVRRLMMRETFNHLSSRILTSERRKAEAQRFGKLQNQHHEPERGGVDRKAQKPLLCDEPDHKAHRKVPRDRRDEH